MFGEYPCHPCHQGEHDAGRAAYLAAFHAAQAFIFEGTGKIAKIHRGLHSEFARLAKDDPRIDKSFPVFLTQAYNLKAVADYEMGPGAVIPPERAEAAAETAGRFIDWIPELIGRLVAAKSHYRIPHFHARILERAGVTGENFDEPDTHPDT